MNRGLGAAIFAAGLLISGCSLAGDITPPPALATAQMALSAELQTPAPLIPPATQPDLAAGAIIYAEKCAACHGLQGLGDGELAEGLAFEPAPLGDPEFARQADPAEWYQVVTIGNLDRLMPGFVSLTDQQRWDVVGYALSLSEGLLPLGAAEEGRSPEAELKSGTVVGRVSNGSEGGALPADLELALLGYDGDRQVVSETTIVEADGSFRFEGLEYAPGRLFFATVIYDGLTFRSDVAHVTADGTALDLPITIYDASDDPGALRVERLHLILDFSAEDTLTVLEVWVLSNTSDRVITAPLQVPLPEGAFNLTFESGSVGDRFELTRDGFVDLEPILPGSGLDHLIFGFDLPGSRSTQFDQLMRHPVDAVSVLIPADGPRVTGLQDRGIQDIGGLRMQNFSEGNLAAEDLLSFQVFAPSRRFRLSATVIIGAAALLVSGLSAARLWVGARPGKLDWEELLQKIARLDDEYEDGKLSEVKWRRKREPLKRQALDQMGKTDD